MRKNIIRNVIVHVADNADIHTISDKVSEFQIIERKLNQSDLTTKQKIPVIL